MKTQDFFLSLFIFFRKSESMSGRGAGRESQAGPELPVQSRGQNSNPRLSHSGAPRPRIIWKEKNKIDAQKHSKERELLTAILTK